MDKKNKMLLIVDPQYDFIEGGALPVPGGEAALTLLSLYVQKHTEYVFTGVTMDWHPYNHMSFKDDGGEWPRHCVQNSTGAAIFSPLLDALYKNGGELVFLRKGTDKDKEEYSVMKNPSAAFSLKSIIDHFEINEVDVCGLAGDICVLNTVKDLVETFPDIKINILEEYSPSIDGGETLNDYINKNL